MKKLRNKQAQKGKDKLLGEKAGWGITILGGGKSPQTLRKMTEPSIWQDCQEPLGRSDKSQQKVNEFGVKFKTAN